MSLLCTLQSGNFSSSTTWGVVNEFKDYTTIEYLSPVYKYSAAFTPGAITVAGILLKFYQNFGDVGETLDVELYNNTTSTSIATVTCNYEDVPAAFNNFNGLWKFFKFSSPVTLVAGQAYKIGVKTSIANDIGLYRGSTTSDWARGLVTTTNQAPVAGDKLFVLGNVTAVNTTNSVVVDYTSNNTTAYGDGVGHLTSINSPSVLIGNYGTLKFARNATTNLRINGFLTICQNGVLDQGKSTDPIQRAYSSTIEFPCTASGQFGIDARAGEVYQWGQSRSASKDEWMCKLTANASAGATTLNVDTDTGWKSGDTIVISSTSKTYTEYEERTLSADAGASSLTITSSLTYAHNGTGEVVAKIGLLTRNVQVNSTSSTNQCFVSFLDNVSLDAGWVDYQYVGYAGTNKQGIHLDNTSTNHQTKSIKYGVARDGSRNGFWIEGSQDNVVQYCIAYKNAAKGNQGGFYQGTPGADSSVKILNNLAIGNEGYGVYIRSTSVDLQDLISCSNNTGGLYVLDNTNVFATAIYQNIELHSNTSYGLLSYCTASGLKYKNITTKRNNSYGVALSANNSTVFEDSFSKANGNSNIYCSAVCYNTKFIRASVNSESGYTTNYGLNITSTAFAGITFIDSDFGDILGHTNSDILMGTGTTCELKFYDSSLNSTTMFNTLVNMSGNSTVSFEDYQRIAGDKRRYRQQGYTQTDTSIYKTASPSRRITPSTSVVALDRDILRADVAAGQTATVKVWVRESVSGDGADFNGNRVKLYVRANHIAGITADTLLATATASSEGAWEELSGTTAAVDARCTLEFYLLIDGSTGWINFDDITAPTALNTLDCAGGDETMDLIAVGNNSVGGGGSPATNFYVG